MTVYGHNDRLICRKSGFPRIENVVPATVLLYRGYRVRAQPAELTYEHSWGGQNAEQYSTASGSHISDNGTAPMPCGTPHTRQTNFSPFGGEGRRLYIPFRGITTF